MESVLPEDRTLLERHLVLRDGGDIRPLGESEMYKTVMGQIDPLSDYVSFQSFAWMWEGVKQAGGGGFMPFDVGQLMQEMGVFSMKATSGGVKIGDNGISSQSFLLVPAPRQGVMKAAVPGDKVNVKPPSFVAGDAALYAGLYFDVPVFWAEFKEALKKTAPQMHQMMEMRLNNPQSPIQIERDLINALGAHWYVYVPKEVYVPQPQGGPGDINVVIAVELKDTAAFQRFFQQMMAMMPPDQGMKQVPFMGVTIYETPPFGQEGPFQTTALRMMFLGNTFVLTTSEAMAKQTVRLSKQGKSALLDKAEFKDTLGHLPRSPEGVIYADQRYVGEWIYKLVDKYVPHENVTLPQWKTLEKYLFVSTAVLNWNDQGLKVTGWQPFPPKNTEGK